METNNLPSPFNIMIVDDDDDLREALSWVLVKEGFSVKAYGNPLLALETLQQGTQIPKVMLVDYQMEGMNGASFLALKDKVERPGVKECPVLMISASPTEVEQEVERRFYKELLVKPINFESLLSNMKRLA